MLWAARVGGLTPRSRDGGIWVGMEVEGQADLVGGGGTSSPCCLVASTCATSCASLSAERPKLVSLLTPCPRSVATLCTETLPLLAVTFITENSLVAAVSPGWGCGVGAASGTGGRVLSGAACFPRATTAARCCSPTRRTRAR